ncbi:MAG: T9SS type A sorting domain-containing protein [Bacteroidetes bacterium]|nr:T9SS type A sorting domain-containing protein [Bacteroidota bacterium]MBU1718920.1 T9SS type A sorting domain-containing protein [Bacteroidota bacterium]
MRKMHFAIVIIQLVLSGMLSAQGQMIKFQKAFGGGLWDEGHAVCQMSDNGYLIAGTTSSFGNGNTDMVLYRLDSLGKALWIKSYGTTLNESAYGLIETRNKDFVFAGFTNGAGAGGYDFYIVRVDSLGDTLWTRTIGGADWDFAYSLAETPDSGIVVAGESYSFSSGNSDMFVVKLSASGDSLWSKHYGGSGYECAYSIVADLDSNLLLAGSTTSFGAGNEDVYLVKLKPDGDSLWTKTYGGEADDLANSCITYSGGGYAIAGITGSFGGGMNDYWLLRTNESGDTLFTKTYGSYDNEEAYTVCETFEGGFVIAGSTNGPGYFDIYFFKSWSDGNWYYATSHGGIKEENAYCVKPTTDGGYIVVGVTNSFGSGFTDIYVIKTDQDGFTGPFNDVEELPVVLGDFAVFPNPCSDYLRIKGIAEGGLLNVRIFSVAGVLVYETNGQKSEAILDMSLIASGIYFIEISECSTEKIFRSKVIKK